MKTKQAKEEVDKGEEEASEPKTRGRKKASDVADDKNPEEPKSSKETKKNAAKPKAVIKRKPLGIRKALRSKKAVVVKEKLKTIVKGKRGRKPVIKTEPDASQDKETIPIIIPPAEIKKEPVEESLPDSRSSSPRTAGRRQRVSSDLAMMKSMLSESASNLVLGPRTSPYSMRSERSNSPLENKTTVKKPGRPRKSKALLNKVVIKEQNKRRRLLSDCKTPETTESEDVKKLKRGRSCSRDGSEISKCSDVTESDLSLTETLNDSDGKELNPKLDKPKTELDVNIENGLQISTDKVPLCNIVSKLADNKPATEPSSAAIAKNKNKKLSLKRSTSLDSDNNNSNRIKLEKLNASDIEDKLLTKTENDTLSEARSSILTSMSKTFNKEMSKNIRKARRKKVDAEKKKPGPKANSNANNFAKNSSTNVTSTLNAESEDKHETLETLSKEIDDLINNLDQAIDQDHSAALANNASGTTNQMETISVSKFYGSPKPLGDNNIISTLDTPKKDKDVGASNESTPSKMDECENITLHYEDDSMDKSIDSKQETYKSIDKLMFRLKEFEEFDKKRNRKESESNKSDCNSVMVTNDVVLIGKSGTDIKPLKDIQSVRSPERPFEKENVLSCFENNSAISILKRDQMRKSVDIDLPNSVTLIKRNSFSARKESTSSNQSRENDAISIFEKSLGKDVTLTEIRKSVEKPMSSPTTLAELNQFATLLPNNSSPSYSYDSSQVSITPRLSAESQKHKSRDSLSRKSSESVDTEEKMAVIEKIKSPVQLLSAISIMPAPVAMKSPEFIPLEAEAVAPPLESVKTIPENVPTTSTEEALPSTSTEEAFPTVFTSEVLPTTSLNVPQSISKTEALSNCKEKQKDLQYLTSIAEPVLPEKMVLDNKPEEQLSDELKGINKEPILKSDVPEERMEITDTKSLEFTNLHEKTVVTENITALTENITAVTANITAVTENITAVTANITAVTENNTAVIENITDVTENITDVTENITAVTENITSVTENITSVTENITPVTENITPVTENITAVPTIADKKIKTEMTQIKSVEEIKFNKSAPEVKHKVSKSTRKSTESLPGPSNLLQETPESQKRKENVLRTLGLLTHKAAKEAKIEKQKEKERLYSSALKTKSKDDYTGTLKTVIKLNRGTGERGKQRSSLKMTFQKSKHRGRPAQDMGESAEDEAYYTIERREIGGGAGGTDGGHRKSHYSNRITHDGEAVPEPEPKVNLVIPEKASSFSIHPGRLCMDQCFYCGGKFGLYDTPCHLAQMKSAERQRKVLQNEEKLTVDSCLCDACYRHVDRRANCPSYRKGALHKAATLNASAPSQPPTGGSPEKTTSPPLEDDSEEESPRASFCHAEACPNPAERTIRRKWVMKLRNSVNKLVRLQSDYPGLHTIPLCIEHYRRLAPLTACALCRAKVTKHSNVHCIQNNFTELNPQLKEAGIPVEFSSPPVLCTQCRLYCTLLQRPPNNDRNAKTYRRKLLKIHNVEVPPESENEAEEQSVQEEENTSIFKAKKKSRSKSKPRKTATDPDKHEETSNESDKKDKEVKSPAGMELTESAEATTDNALTAEPMDEDIESLISSNRILVPGAKTQELDGSEIDMQEIDTSGLSTDKQTELQFLLQMQNNPSQFLQEPNLTQKKQLLKVQNITGIMKPGLQHRIHEKNAKRLQKLGQIMSIKDKPTKPNDVEMLEFDASGVPKNVILNEECTIESVSNKKPADINTLKNKWQMSESFTQVKKNLSELSKKMDKDPKYASNPVKRLETNPSISVRELFPGEEEMNLQCNIEFNNVKGVTPEGWEKCSSTIQYDVETKKLWTELQRPYGNQSSFLRHLVLLEKYFRSGDLVLSHNASSSASVYSDSVQSRLRAYDNVVNVDAPRRSEPSISLIEFRKKPSSNGKSLLKNNQEDPKKYMPPPLGVFSKPKPVKEKKAKALPPELIAINTPNAQGRKAIQNVLHNIQQLVKGVSASDPIEVAVAPVPPKEPSKSPGIDKIIPKADTPKLDVPKPENKTKPDKKEKKEDKKDTPKKQKASSKPWRPTLMPITPENLARVSREPKQVAVDGRHLPSLVQVMASGKRYHITLEDYNKMCIMRREKMQQVEEKTPKRKQETESVVTEIQPCASVAMLGNGGTVVQNIPTEKEQDKRDKDMPDLSQIGANAASILKNVGLKNITIAPIPSKTATVTSQTIISPVVSSPALIVTSTPIKLPQLGSSVAITSETILTPTLPTTPTSAMIMPKIPKSLTVIPQAVSLPQSVVVTSTSIVPSQAVIQTTDCPRP